MPIELASADAPASPNWTLVLVLTYIGIIAATALLAFVIFRLAKGRGHRQIELLAGGAVVWGMLAAGLFLYASTRQLNWSNEQTTLIESGYYDPQDTTAAPAWPWIATSVIAAAYAALIAAAMWHRGLRPPSDGSP